MSLHNKQITHWYDIELLNKYYSLDCVIPILIKYPFILFYKMYIMFVNKNNYA